MFLSFTESANTCEEKTNVVLNACLQASMAGLFEVITAYSTTRSIVFSLLGCS